MKIKLKKESLRWIGSSSEHLPGMWTPCVYSQHLKGKNKTKSKKIFHSVFLKAYCSVLLGFLHSMWISIYHSAAFSSKVESLFEKDKD